MYGWCFFCSVGFCVRNGFVWYWFLCSTVLAFCHQSLRRCPSKRASNSQASHLCFGLAPICEADSTRKTVLRMSVDGLGKDTNQLLQVLHPVAGSDGFGIAIGGKFLEPVFAADLHRSINMHDQAFMVLCFVQLIYWFWLQETVAATVNSPHQLVIPRFQQPGTLQLQLTGSSRGLACFQGPMSRPRHGGCKWGQHACQHLNGFLVLLMWMIVSGKKLLGRLTSSCVVLKDVHQLMPNPNCFFVVGWIWSWNHDCRD